MRPASAIADLLGSRGDPVVEDGRSIPAGPRPAAAATPAVGAAAGGTSGTTGRDRGTTGGSVREAAAP